MCIAVRARVKSQGFNVGVKVGIDNVAVTVIVKVKGSVGIKVNVGV